MGRRGGVPPGDLNLEDKKTSFHAMVRGPCSESRKSAIASRKQRRTVIFLNE
jgi:hypothetical protein